MNPRFVSTLSNVLMPRIIYGTAWKKEKTTDLVVQAILTGFRGIDTACQPKHYREDLVGEALTILFDQHAIQRSELFLQTKFTSLDGQGPFNVPYDRNASLPDQVKQSITKSLENLRTDYIDSLVLHSPMQTHEKTMTVWKVFEEHYKKGIVKQLGISNIYEIKSLEKLYADASIKPSIVQNRFYQYTGYDKQIRAFCDEHGIKYQSFWTLTANPHILKDPLIRQIASKHGRTAEQVFFRYIMDIGIIPLTGTTDPVHMKQDLEVLDMPPLGDAIVKINELLGL